MSDGLYGVVRHPQYLGLFIALFGEGVVHWPTPFSVILFPVIVFAYMHLAQNNGWSNSFGDEYRAYQRRVPMFISRGDQWRQLLKVPESAVGKDWPIAQGQAACERKKNVPNSLSDKTCERTTRSPWA